MFKQKTTTTNIISTVSFHPDLPSFISPSHPLYEYVKVKQEHENSLSWNKAMVYLVQFCLSSNSQPPASANLKAH